MAVDLSQIPSVIANARQAQKKWAKLSFDQRKTYIKKMRAYIVKNADSMVEVLCQDTGKARIDALADEVLSCAFACRWYANNAKKVLRPRKLKNSIPIMFHKNNVIIRPALGLVGIISPWNYPLAIPFGEIVMGLMAGNALLVKTSYEVTPRVGKLIEEIIRSVKLPESLVTIVEAPGAEFADALFANHIDKIFFTGSVRVGKELMRKASATLTPLSLELGGKDPMLVLEDADLEQATNGAAWGGYQNAGQTCAGIERIYVHEKVYEPFIELLAKKTKALTHGHYSDINTEIGALSTEQQLKTVQNHVEEAVKSGARILAQSLPKNVDKGRYFPATLLTEVDHSMTIMKEETFGPVLCVMKVRDDEEAIAKANDSQYALTSSVWSRDLDKAKELAKRLESGVTTINDHIITHAFSETPWGGWKNSGIGRTHGAIGLEEMTHCKVINWDSLASKRSLFWYPFDQETYDGLKTALQVSFPQNPLDMLVGLAKLIPFASQKMFSAWNLNKNRKVGD